MASIDKEIQIIMLRGKTGATSYEDAVKHNLFSGTLEEWIETFATPDNYITRYEFQKVTQEEYDALEEAQLVIPNCYYVITDDDSWDVMQQIISDMTDISGSIETMSGDIETLQGDVETLQTNLGTAEDDIDNLQSDVGGLQTDVGRIDQSVSDMQSDILALQRKGETPTINACSSTGENKVVTTSYNLTELTEGTQIYIKFAQYGATTSWHYMTLNVNNLGAKTIYALGSVITNDDPPAWYSGDIVKLIYEYNSTLGDYVWNVQENITKHKYFGTLYSR